ncbi:ribosomal protein L7/L12 [Kitasatospora xanthocidica]|uniref:Ribosomal protein L7/L12 n=1 Tax=Kitasatospora xanthocidica TaxID=83382 RepID=A0A372ZQV0_9ACTN|nr:ribosomal protein L7/L12 [Kitasatospora xanthocidica]RGD58236.1 ribosomal protein L7/L12 [Kitasatospora xanthocidica]
MTVEYSEPVCGEASNRVVLTGPGPHVLEAVKALRRWTGLSLWHGEVFLGRLPASILEDVPSDLAEAAANELRASGAAVEVRH